MAFTMAAPSLEAERELAAFFAYPRGGPTPADSARVAHELVGLARDLHAELEELRSDVADLGRRVRELELERDTEAGAHSIRVPSSLEAIEAVHAEHVETLLGSVRARLGRYWS